MNNNQNILVESQTKKLPIIKLISAYMLTWMAVYPLVYVMLASMLRIFGINIFSSLNKFIIALFFSFITTVWTIIAINEDKNGYTLIAVSRKMPVLICFCAIIYGVFSCCYK